MQDHELYRRILGIEAPWFVDAVDLKLEAGEIHVHLKHHEMINWQCSECGADCKLYDHQPERRWRHLDTCQYQTILHAEPPRSGCDASGVGDFNECPELLDIQILRSRFCDKRGLDG